jgi:glutathione synthase/RimK-type ligase-like ATP-grasp enzyme
MNRRIRAVILSNELNNDHHLWINACKAYSDRLEYTVINLTSDNWFESIKKITFDILLAKPGGLTAHFKQLYDERIYILSEINGFKIYPSAQEIFIYENKRLLSFWLKANNIPHPSTHVFYNYVEVSDYLRSTSYPIVAKVNIGSSGSGVTILFNLIEANEYIKEIFKGKGAKQRSGPNFKKGSLLKRSLHYVFNPNDIRKKLSIYQTIKANAQKGYILFQEYVPHEFEWRVVRIGASFFAHKKLKIGEKASGSTRKIYDNPPLQLLDFVRDITDKFAFYSQAIDVFETSRGYLVNEMQCIFGQSDKHQMLVDGIPGRYIYRDNYWIFEPGDFCVNECFNLRVDWIINNYL